MSARIYPVPVKPPSAINSWGGWPADVRDTLRRWNKDRAHLTFIRSPWTFKCAGCSEFCRANAAGAAVHLDDWVCDDCLIERARSAIRGHRRRGA